MTRGAAVRWSRPLIAMLLLAMLSPLSARPAAGQAGEVPLGSGGPAAIELLGQDPWVGPRGTFHLEVRTDTPTAGYRLDVRIYQPVQSVGEVFTSDVESVPTRLRERWATLNLDQPGTQLHSLARDVVPTQDGTAGYPLVAGPGVYPIRLQLLDERDEIAASMVTHLVHLPDDLRPGAVPLGVIAEVRVDPERAEDGRARMASTVAADLEARFESLAAFPDVPVSLQLRPETVSALIETRGFSGGAALQALQDVAGIDGVAQNELLTSTYVGFDESGWVADGQSDVLRAELDAGRATLAGAALRADPATAAVQSRTDPTLLARLYDFGVRHVIAAQPSTTQTSTTGTAGGVFLGTAPHRIVELPKQLVLPPADHELPRSSVARPGQLGTLEAHRVLAALLLGPLAGDRRGLQLRFTDRVELEGSFADALFGALGSGGPIRPVPVSDLFADESHYSEPKSWGSTTVSPRVSGTRSQKLAAVNQRLQGLASIVEDRSLIAELEARLLLVPADRIGDSRADAILASVNADIDARTAQIVLPADQAFTITAHREALPLVILNKGDSPVQIQLSFASTELEFRGENPLLLTLAPGPNDLEIPVQTRRSGDFGFQVIAQSPDAQLTLGDVSIRVQSRAISGVGVLLSAGALLFLLWWWIRNSRKRRNRPAPHTETEGLTGTATTVDGPVRTQRSSAASSPVDPPSAGTAPAPVTPVSTGRDVASRPS